MMTYVPKAMTAVGDHNHERKEHAMLPHPMTQIALEDLRRKDLLDAVARDNVASRAVVRDDRRDPGRSRGAFARLSWISRGAGWTAVILRLIVSGMTANDMTTGDWRYYRLRRARGT